MERMTEFDKEMSAVTFAEAGDHETAASMLAEVEKKTPSRQSARKSKLYMKTLIFGIISAAAYFAVFTNEKLVTENFTMGGWHTLFPVGTALVFSFIHGAFASNFLSMLGIEAKK